MKELSSSITIAAPVETVWDVFNNFADYYSWN